jgi:hypothetical protein
LRPRAEWEPIERWVIETLHEHVLEGMRQRAEKGDQQPAEPYRKPAEPAAAGNPAAQISGGSDDPAA